MTHDEFDAKFREMIPAGTVIQNPGGGVSEVLSNRNGVVSYRRGSSTISVSTKSLFDAFAEFRGKRMSSTELKSCWPSVFDSTARPAGHSCNATFLFLALEKMGIVHEIRGKGVRGNPFLVEVPK